MDHDRFQMILTITLADCDLSPLLDKSIRLQALRQLQDRYPLAGCGVTFGRENYVIVVGRH